jgi:hypothetical protein
LYENGQHRDDAARRVTFGVVEATVKAIPDQGFWI